MSNLPPQEISNIKTQAEEAGTASGFAHKRCSIMFLYLSSMLLAQLVLAKGELIVQALNAIPSLSVLSYSL